jgi:hypothetical protein
MVTVLPLVAIFCINVSVPFFGDSVRFLRTVYHFWKTNKGPLDAHGLLLHPLHKCHWNQKQAKLSNLETLSMNTYLGGAC